ncbi:hypothetical protein MRX96_009120 [Rhipicephalus microplus]
MDDADMPVTAVASVNENFMVELESPGGDVISDCNCSNVRRTSPRTTTKRISGSTSEQRKGIGCNDSQHRCSSHFSTNECTRCYSRSLTLHEQCGKLKPL